MSKRRAEAFERYFPDPYKLAFHLTSNARAAETAVITAFARCFSRFEHLRSDDLFEQILLAETWRASVPRLQRPAHAEAAAHMLREIGVDPSTIAADFARPSADIWSKPPEPDDLPVVDALPSPGAFTEAIGKARRRTAIFLLSLTTLTAAITWGATRQGSRSTPPPVAGELPEILPQSYAPRGPKVELVAGSLENKPWSVTAYRAEHRSVCIELRVDNTYGDVHCPSDFKVPLRAYVGPDAKHRTTFLYGYARSDVTDISVKVKGSPAVGVEIGRDRNALGTDEPGGFFAVTVPGYLLPLTDRRQGESLGYKVYALRLSASGADGKKIGTQKLLLGRSE